MMISEQFALCNIENHVMRIPDRDQQKWSTEFELANKYYNRIINVPEVCLKEIPNYDVMVVCSPTYFGNVSAEIKAFMDDMACYWMNRKMSGKIMIACASASTHMGGGDLALQSIATFAQHMGMVPYPVNTLTMPAYGLLHIAGEQSQFRVGDTTLISDAAKTIADDLIRDTTSAS